MYTYEYFGKNNQWGYTNPHNEIEYAKFPTKLEAHIHHKMSCLNSSNLELQEAFMAAIASPTFMKLAAVFVEWNVAFDLFENLHDVCDPNQALIDAFFADEDFDNEEAVNATVERSSVIVADWDKIIHLLNTKA